MKNSKRCDLCGVGETWTTSDGAIWLKCPPSRIVRCRLYDPLRYAANCQRFKAKAAMTREEIQELRLKQKNSGFF